MREKVGELYAELGIEDQSPRQLEQAERNLRRFHDRAEGLPDVRVQMDVETFDKSVDRAASSHGRFIKQASSEKVAPDFDSGPLMDGADGAEDQLGSKIRQWATSLGVAAAVVGGAVAKELFGSFQDYLDRERTTDQLAAALGLTPAEQERYGRIAGEVYGNAFGDSVADVTGTMRFALNQGLIDPKMTDEQVATVTSRLTDMADLYGQDVSRMASAIGTMLKTGMARDVWEAMDILTVGLQGPANKADDLMDTFEEYSTQFRALGIDGPMALGLLSQAVEGGARNADIAADALKEFGIRGKDGSQATADAYAALGLSSWKMSHDLAAGGTRAAGALDTVLDSLRKVEDPVKRNQLAVALFGTTAEDLQGALDSMDPTTAIDGLEGIAGAAEKASEVAGDNAATSLEGLQRRTKMGIEDYLGSLWTAYEEGGLDGLLGKLSDDLDDLSAWWDENGPELMEKWSAWWQESGAPLVNEAIGIALEAAGDALWAYISSLFEGAKTAISDKAKGMWDGIRFAFVEAINAIISAWNNLELKLPAQSTPFGEIGGWVLSTPDIPLIENSIGDQGNGMGGLTGWAHGLDAGPVPGPRGAAFVGLLHGGEVVLTPGQQADNQRMLNSAVRALHAARGGGNGSTTNVYLGSMARANRDGLWERAA